MPNFSFSVNCSEPADVLFQNIQECDEFFPPDNFSQICFIIDPVNDPTSTRAIAKHYRRHYGTDRFTVLDIDQTFPIYDRLLLETGSVSTEEVVRAFLDKYDSEHADDLDDASEPVEPSDQDI